MIEPLDLLWYVVILCCVAPFLLVAGFLTATIGMPALFVWIMEKIGG